MCSATDSEAWVVHFPSSHTHTDTHSEEERERESKLSTKLNNTVLLVSVTIKKKRWQTYMGSRNACPRAGCKQGHQPTNPTVHCAVALHSCSWMGP